MNILIIGAGGVTSYLLPVLLKSFPLNKVVIQDKDILEARNLDRQAFDERFVGRSKAKSLVSMYKRILRDSTISLEAVDQWFESGRLLADFDIVICAADNHTARRNSLFEADCQGKICIIAGNEYFDNEAYIYYPHDKGTERDPRVRYPEIETDTSGNPVRCTGEAQEAHPQLAIANMGAAHKILHLLWNHVHSKASLKYLPFELKDNQYECKAVA